MTEYFELKKFAFFYLENKKSFFGCHNDFVPTLKCSHGSSKLAVLMMIEPPILSSDTWLQWLVVYWYHMYG